jgi:hypothetical protein
MREEARRVKTEMVKRAFGRRCDAYDVFDAEYVGSQQVAPWPIELFTNAQRAYQCRHRRMQDSAQMRIIVVESVDQHAVHQHRIAQRQPFGHADDRAITVFRHAAYARENAVRKVVARRRERDANGVEYEILGALAHRARYRVVTEAIGEGGKLLRDRRTARGCNRRVERNGCRCAHAVVFQPESYHVDARLRPHA